MVEVFLLIAIWLGHSQRLFAVQRIRTTMDQIVAVRERETEAEIRMECIRYHAWPYLFSAVGSLTPIITHFMQSRDGARRVVP